tara:strand:- start:937 stop:1191 length:255 start_codon:yes stop_codon:yes gene_type:complete
MVVGHKEFVNKYTVMTSIEETSVPKIYKLMLDLIIIGSLALVSIFIIVKIYMWMENKTKISNRIVELKEELISLNQTSICTWSR